MTLQNMMGGMRMQFSDLLSDIAFLDKSKGATANSSVQKPFFIFFMLKQMEPQLIYPWFFGR